MVSALRAHRPGRDSDRTDLITRLMADEAYEAALSLLMPRIEGGFDDPVVLDQAATCFWHLQEGLEAIRLMHILVEGWPKSGASCVKLASYALGSGDVERAETALHLAFERGHKSAHALALLNRITPLHRNSAHVRRLKSLAESPDVTSLERAVAQNTLGRIEHQSGRYRAAFRRFSNANRLHGEIYRPREISALVAGQLLNFDPTRLPKRHTSEPRMLFITGLPRSGTTVLEQSLDRHSQILALGESCALSRTVMDMRRQAGSTGAWDWFGRMSEQERSVFRQRFLSLLPHAAQKSERVLVFKMPFDCFDLGVAAWLWPTARFVHMSRHPLDVGMSNFVTLFHAGHAYSRRLEWIAHMIRAVGYVMEDYQAKLGGAMRMQSYRALLEDPERQLKAILNHAGLSWDSACLHPENSKRPVRTASVGQIEGGVNKAGLEKWAAYRPQLTALVDGLGSEWLARWQETDTPSQK